ncbi:unnamed protein product [Caenorhabditis auriculariae]|uniref:Serine/threonine-protein phosphatase n=1 Tax=Caenorhabditis auriculariae TaxID=2777116 RepID=A0A8S1HVU9_9PELO|nr:unnamed protein product [Caenorhabditis auriculariae]
METRRRSDYEEEEESTADDVDQHRKDFLRSFVDRLLGAPLISKAGKLQTTVDVFITLEEVRAVTLHVCTSLHLQPSLLRINAGYPIHIIGDLHGQFHDLRSIFTRCGHPSNTSYLFLGDYVDRGVQGLETSLLLLALKALYPERVFLLRGNHEDFNTSVTYGFYDECILKYLDCGELVWLHLINAFNHLPICALIGGKVMCMHGGISPHINSLADIENIRRPSIVPSYGLMCDLVWSDPESSVNPGWSLSARGISFSFDETTIENFCRQHDIDVIIRAHQITTDMFNGGYKLHAGGRMVTVFSAPNYLNMSNDSCVVRIDSNLCMRFIVFRPVRKQKANKNSKSIAK